MFILSEKIKKLVLLVIALVYVGAGLQSQTVPVQINVNVVVTPPFPTDVYSYSNRAKVIITSTQTTRVLLKVAIKGDNGIILQTPPGFSPGFISLDANTPYQVPEQDLGDYFNYYQMQLTGITQEEIQKNGLPVGSYRVCITVIDADGASLSAERCSNVFNIVAVQPPQIIQPICGSDQYKNGIQTILFAWAPSPGAPSWTQYTLRIIEITNPELSPAEALQSAPTPPFFEQEVQGNSYLYGPNDPLLEKGNRYVFEVIAKEGELHTPFANQGRSEFCYFTYGKPDTTGFLPIVVKAEPKPKRKTTTTPTTNMMFPGITFSPANLSGTLYYQYAGPPIASTQLIPKEQQNVSMGNKPVNISPTQSNQQENQTDNIKLVQVNNQSVQLTKSNYAFNYNLGSSLQDDVRNKAQSFPLANMPFKLIVKYKIYDKTLKKHVLLSAYDVQTSNIPKKYTTLMPDQVLASGTTDAGGHFDQTFLLKDTMGLLAQNIKVTIGSGEFFKNYSGDLYRVIRLIVGSDHFCSPAQDMVVQPFGTQTYDDLYALVRNYGLTVKTTPYASENTYISGNIEGLDVYILRKTRPYDVPKDEGFPKPKSSDVLPNFPGYQVIAHTTTKGDGSASFLHLVKNLSGYDKYYIYANSQSSQTYDYESLVKDYKNIHKNEDFTGIEIPENAVYNDEYEYSADYVSKLTLLPRPPSIYGEVRQAGEKGGQAIDDADVGLYSLGLLIPLKVMSTKTDDGKYVFKNIYQTYYTNNGQKVEIPYAVKASKSGFKDKTVAVNNGAGLKYGQKVMVSTILLDPKAIIGGKIIDEQTGSGVRCHVTVMGGQTVDSDPPLLVPKQQGNSKAVEQNEVAIIQNLSKSFSAFPNNNSQTIPVFQVTPVSQTSSKSNISVSNSKPAVTANTTIGGLANMQMGPSYFALPAPSGKQTIILDPFDHTKYFTDTIDMVLKDGLNTVTLNAVPKIHRIKLTVSETKPSGYVVSFYKSPPTTAPKKIYKARVKVVGRTDYELTNEVGVVTLEFGGSDNFEIEVLPPEDADYESNTKSFSGIPATRDYLKEEITLNKASRISGIVKFDNKPVEGARVKLDYPGKNIEVNTGTDGQYTLKNVPLGKNLIVRATKENYIGDSAVVTLTSNWKDSVNLKLIPFGTMNYSKLLGFPIEVSGEDKEGGKTYITGEFVNLPRNGQIETNDDKQTLKFTHIEVTAGPDKAPDGLPYPVPAGDQVLTDLNSILLKLNSTFTGSLEDKNGIKVGKGSSTSSGFIKGQVMVNTDQSFQTNALSFGQEKMFVTQTGSSGDAPPVIDAIASDGAKPFGNDGIMPLCNQDAKNISYTLYNFKSEAKAKDSRISGSKVYLNTVLHTDLKNVGQADLAVQLGDVELTTTGIAPLSKTTAITMPLEKWSMTATKWSLSNYGFILNEGKVKTQMADISFTNMEVDPIGKELKYGNFNLSTLDIKGITTLTVTGSANFFFESGHWKLAIMPKGDYCGYIPPLPGMPANQNLNVKSIFLKSDNTGTFSVDSKPFKLYGLIDFNPTSLAVYDDRIEFPGTVNLNIPEIPARSGLIKYKRIGSSINLTFQPFIFDFTTKGVYLKFSLDENSLQSTGFTAKGTLSEPGLYSVNVQLNHSTSKTEIVDIPGQTFPIDKSGNKRLNNFDGEMHVASGQWTNFTFNGDLVGANGASSKLTFVVKGDVVADGQSVKVDKIPTPFGDMSYTFDFAHSRLIGNLEIYQELNGTGLLKASAESVVDGSGWYFCAGGELTMKNNPYIKKLSTALLFGDYPATNDPFITQTFSTYSYNHALPKAFQNHISGFYIDGSAEFPVPYVPNIDVDLVVVSGHVGVSAGGDFNLGMNFSDAGNTYYTGAAVFVEAHIGLGGSIGIACAGASFGAKVELAQKGELKSNGDWFLEGTNTLTLTGSAYAGGGCCDSDCDHITLCPAPCFSDSWSGSKSFQFLVHMGSDDNYVKLNW